MSDPVRINAEAWAAGLEPEPALLVSEWADTFRMLSQQASVEPGPYRTSRTPYLRDLMDALSPSSPVEFVVLMKGAQVGGTECGNNFLGYVIHHAPGPMLYVQPTVEMAKRTSKQRIDPMIEACPELQERVKDPRSRDSGNTMLAKEFPGGILVMTGANSAVGLRSMPARYLFLDEVDAYEVDVDGEGDPVELAIRRTATFRSNRKVLIVSTPKLKGTSRIERAFERSDKRYYHVPCPHCGLYQPIRWAYIRWPEGEPSKAVLVCEACEQEIPEAKKGWMLEQGRWEPTAVGDPGVAGFHLSALYSPPGWYSWAQAAADFLKAKHEGLEAMKTWVNTVLGETWEEPGDSVDHSVLFTRREAYPENARVADGVLCLTCGVDVQDDRLELEVVGWGMGEESWGIDYTVLHGDPGQPELWNMLSDALAQTYADSHGLRFHIASTCIDSGGHYTQIVYGFCRLHKARRIFATKGRAGEGLPIVSSPSRRRSGRNRRPVELFTIGVDAAKGLIYSRLKRTEPGPGYCHFPMQPDYDEEYFAQLTAERIQTRYHKGFAKREWVKTRPRNEALDCRVGALAALYLLNPNWNALDRRIRASRERPKDASVWAMRPRRALSRPRPSGWVHGWRRM